MKSKCLCYLTVLLVLLACNDSSRKIENSEYSPILSTSLTCILEHHSLAEEYYNEPLQILQNKQHHVDQDMVIMVKKVKVLFDGCSITL